MERERPLLLRVAQVATLLGISERSVWKHSTTGEIPPPVRIGRSQRWSRKAIDQFIEDKMAGTATG